VTPVGSLSYFKPYRKQDSRVISIVSNYSTEDGEVPIRFIAKISDYDKKHLGFFVPKYEKEFY
jgi:hypothetical protein